MGSLLYGDVSVMVVNLGLITGVNTCFRTIHIFVSSNHRLRVFVLWGGACMERTW